MERRGVLALVAPLLAGCFGGEAVRERATPESRPQTATDTPKPDTPAAETVTATDTPEPAETPASTDGEAEAQFRAAREQIAAAVEAYAGDADLPAVRADDGFDAGEVYAALTQASAAVGRAKALASTDEATTTVDRLGGVVAFLSHATAAQAGVVEGHDALVAARAALAEEGEVGSDGHLEEVRSAVEAVERALSHVESESEAADAAAVEALDADAYRTKVAQFEAGAAALDGAADAAATLSDGLVLLETARTRGENGDEESAAEDAAEAEEKLTAAASTFGDLVDGLPAEAGAFEAPLDAFAELAATEKSAAADLAAQYE